MPLTLTLTLALALALSLARPAMRAELCDAAGAGRGACGLTRTVAVMTQWWCRHGGEARLAGRQRRGLEFTGA